MRILTIIFCSLFVLSQTFAQPSRKLTTFLSGQFNQTIYDRTTGNNPWAVGLGLQTFFNNNTRFKPTIELTGDIYLKDDKILRLNDDGTIPITDNDVSSMINLFVGFAFLPTKNTYLSFVAGPSFINGKTLLGLKSSFGFYLSTTQRWTTKISYINIFNRGETIKEDFGSISLSIGLRLF